MITERVTGLEAFSLCPHKRKHVPFDGANINTFIAVNVGDIVHTAHQYPDTARKQANIFFDEVLPAITGKRDNIGKQQLLNIILLAEGWIEDYKDKPKEFEIKNTVTIGGMVVTGSYDCLVLEEDGLYHLYDFKTAKSLSYYDNRVEKKQVQLYAYMIMKRLNIDKIKVTYLVYVKGNNNTNAKRHDISRMFYLDKQPLINQASYIDDIENKVNNIVDNYKMCRELDLYEPSPQNEDGSANSACWYCPLKTGEKAEQVGLPMCPAYQDKSFINFEDDIEF